MEAESMIWPEVPIPQACLERFISVQDFYLFICNFIGEGQKNPPDEVTGVRYDAAG